MEPKRTSTIERIKEGFRKYQVVESEEIRDKLLNECEEHVLFLRMLVPKHKWQQRSNQQRESVRVVSRDGKLIEASKHDASSRGSSQFKGDWHKDPEVISRHQRLAERQYFLNRR
jgi:hypothetical protein